MFYNEKILTYFQSDIHVGTLFHANAKVLLDKAGSKIEFSAEIKNDIIQKFHYRAKGPTTLLACCSYIAEQLQNKQYSDAEKITYQSLVSFFEISEKNFSNALLAEDALRGLLESANV